MVTIAHEQNIICTKTRLDVTTHEQAIICRQLFAGHVVGSRPMEKKEKIHRMIIGGFHVTQISLIIKQVRK